MVGNAMPLVEGDAAILGDERWHVDAVGGVHRAHAPRWCCAFVGVLLGVSIVVGGGVSDKLAVGGYNAPISESTHAAEFLDQNFGTTANLVIQLMPREGHHRQP